MFRLTPGEHLVWGVFRQYWNVIDNPLFGAYQFHLCIIILSDWTSGMAMEEAYHFVFEPHEVWLAGGIDGLVVFYTYILSRNVTVITTSMFPFPEKPIHFKIYWFPYCNLHHGVYYCHVYPWIVYGLYCAHINAITQGDRSGIWLIKLYSPISVTFCCGL